MRKGRIRKLKSQKIVIQSRGEFKVDRSCAIYELDLKTGEINRVGLEILDKRDGYEVYKVHEKPGCLYMPALNSSMAKVKFEQILGTLKKK